MHRQSDINIAYNGSTGRTAFNIKYYENVELSRVIHQLDSGSSAEDDWIDIGTKERQSDVKWQEKRGVV